MTKEQIEKYAEERTAFILSCDYEDLEMNIYEELIKAMTIIQEQSNEQDA